ncbi:MAG: efflux RND transporter periplasmic adaptor subunit [Myxococcales bacterium]|nr:efflux RND transporter periplasmic adaptor subunit [Myxococcales bacterium]
MVSSVEAPVRPSGGWIPARCAALGVALGALLVGCGPEGAGARLEGDAERIMVEYTRIEPETLRDVATFSGQLDSEHSVMMKTETDGVIESVSFEEGQQVERGAVLFKLRSGEQRARLREALANRALAEEVYERTRKLVTRDATSLAQRDRATAELEVAKARVDLARLELDRTEVRAPFDGVLGSRGVDPGDRVTDETPLVQIDAIERLQVSFGITEQGVAFARNGAPIQIRVLPYPGETFAGEVFFVSPTLDPAARRLILKAWVPNADGRLRPGLFADVDLEIAQRENALLVPESAVVFDRHGTFVWRVEDDDSARRVPIEVGLRKGGRVEVTLGLRPGDTVVSAGTHKVSEGEKLQSAAPASSGQARREGAVAAAPGEGT